MSSCYKVISLIFSLYPDILKGKGDCIWVLKFHEKCRPVSDLLNDNT